MTTMDIQAMATRLTRTDILVEATMSPISGTIMIGRTITEPDITIRSAATASSPTRAALAAGMKEALVVAGMASVAEDSVVAMVVVDTAAAGIAKQLDRI